MEDFEIISLYFERDEKAIRETDLKYGRRLHAISENITSSSEDADECVSDTYLAAWNQIPPTRPLSFFAFLSRIVRNLSVDLFRKNTAGKRSANLVSLDEELSEIIPDPSDCEEGGLTRIIESFLREEEREARALFVRRYYYADSVRDLSRLTGLSESGIAMRLLRLRKKLKERLKKEGYEL